MAYDLDTVVVGAGVVGLAIGRALAVHGREVVVVERHGLIGSETSSRNSEVIHAGIYYPTGSLRARLCVSGKQALYRFCAENGVAHRACQKLIVATHDEQLPKLDALAAKARENGVDDLVRLSAGEASALEPAVRCCGALLSPSTGIIDSHGLMLALEGHITSQGGQVVLNTPVTSVSQRDNASGFVIEMDGEIVTCRTLVIAAGLGATELARTMRFESGYEVPHTFYAKGQYYAWSGASPFSRHIYPMPQGAWLGLHATVDIGGRCKFGPDIAWIDEIDYGFEPGKLTKFLDSIRLYFPDLDPAKLHPDYTGIRPKLYREGEAVPDFRIDGPEAHGVDDLVLLFGIESPGLTSALAIGDLVAGLITEKSAKAAA
ncbi:MAG: NAD(P)/FAD-dependent oxidoreductase [Hyphomicrobiaceae bacterium]